MNISMHDAPVHLEKRQRSAHVSGYSFPRSQRDESASYSDISVPRYRSSLEIIPFDSERSRGRKPKFWDESTSMQGSWADTPALPRPGTPDSQNSTKLSGSPKTREKTVRFSDRIYMSSGLPERVPGNVGRRRDSLRGQSGDHLSRGSGNGDTTDGLHQCGRYTNSLPKRLQAGGRQRGHLPPAPTIPRLPTPDFESTSPYQLRPGKHDFCACCHNLDDGGEDDSLRWMKGKAKMEKQGTSSPFSFSFTGS